MLFNKKIRILLILLLSILWIVILWGIRYQMVVDWIVQKYHFSISQQKIFQQKLLSPKRFFLLKGLAVLCFPLLLLSINIFFEKYAVIQCYLLSLKNQVKHLFKQIKSIGKTGTQSEKIGTLLAFSLLLIFKSYIFVRLPFHIDELSTFLFFTNKGWLVSLAYYPSPNNHVFYTLLTTAFYTIIKEPIWAVKLPSFLISIATLPLLYMLIFQKTKKAWIALLVMLFWGLLPSTFLYGGLGRGYTLMLFLMLLAYGSFEKLIKEKKPLYNIIFVVSSVLATYTLTSYLYVLCGFLVWGLFMKFPIYLLKLYFVIGIGIILLYTPILLFNDLSVISASDWAIALPWYTLPSAFLENLYLLGEMLFGWEVVGAILFFMFLIASMTMKNIGKSISLYFLLGIVPLILWQMAMPPTRVFIYLLVPIIFELSDLLAKHRKLPVIFLLLLLIPNIYHDALIPAQWSSYKDVKKDMTMIALKQQNLIYTNDDNYAIHLQYKLFEEEKTGKVEVTWGNKNYDWVICTPEKGKDLDLSNYQLIKKRADLILYKRKPN